MEWEREAAGNIILPPVFQAIWGNYPDQSVGVALDVGSPADPQRLQFRLSQEQTRQLIAGLQGALAPWQSQPGPGAIPQ